MHLRKSIGIRNLTLSGLSLFVWCGCQQNPFPHGKMTHDRHFQRKVEAAYSILSPDSIECIEGSKCAFEVKGQVPAPGLPQIQLEGEPDGSVFDVVNNLFSWNVPFGAANDPQDDTVKSRVYFVKILLRSSTDTVAIHKKVVAVTVKDNPRKPNVSYSLPDPLEFREGQETRFNLKVTSEDYPAGPFRLLSRQLPPGATIEPKDHDPTLFEIRYTPSYADVTADSPKEISAAIEILIPDGQIVLSEKKWIIRDERKYATVTSPTEITQGPDVNFSIYAQDPNLEIEPIVTAPSVPYGVISLDKLPAPGPYSSWYSFSWTQIPATHLGTVRNLLFSVCVNGRYHIDHCTSRSITIRLQATVRPAPLFQRQAWPVGLTKYVREGDTLTVNLPITDRDPQSDSMNVEITPDVFRRDISWRAGILTVTARTKGEYNFDVVAASAFGMKQSESFSLVVLPRSWSDSIMIGNIGQNKEVKLSLPLFEHPQLVNPDLQEIDERILALRKYAVVGTAAFKNISNQDWLEKLSAQIGNLYLASPILTAKLGTLQKELEDLGLIFWDRLQNDVRTYSLVPMNDSGLTQPEAPAYLDGTLSPESHSPLTFKIKENGQCKPILRLERPAESYIVGAVCKRNSNKGKIIVTGFEWADIAPLAATPDLAKTWIKELR